MYILVTRWLDQQLSGEQTSQLVWLCYTVKSGPVFCSLALTKAKVIEERFKIMKLQESKHNIILAGYCLHKKPCIVASFKSLAIFNARQLHAHIL